MRSSVPEAVKRVYVFFFFGIALTSRPLRDRLWIGESLGVGMGRSDGGKSGGATA